MMPRVLKQGDMLKFFCPGCEEYHYIPVRRDEGPSWQWDGRVDLPSLFPSILRKTGHFVTASKPGECWCTFEARFGKKSSFKCQQCHSFVEDGNIRYLADCSHSLAGQTVPLPEISGD